MLVNEVTGSEGRDIIYVSESVVGFMHCFVDVSVDKIRGVMHLLQHSDPPLSLWSQTCLKQNNHHHAGHKQ